MQDEIFKAGVQPGGPTSHTEIKALVCYILTKLGQAMSFAELHEALQEGSLVNYFELVQVIDGLVESGHLALEAQEGREYYQITETGVQAGREFENSLPLSVRQKALRSAERLLRRKKRESEVLIETRKADGGYYMELSIPEQTGKLVSFTLFLPTREECERVRRRFLNDPVFIYKCVLAMLTGERDVLGELIPQVEQLF